MYVCMVGTQNLENEYLAFHVWSKPPGTSKIIIV